MADIYRIRDMSLSFRVVVMDFYGRKDITLGAFLERYCFRENYNCPSESCDTLNTDHIRRFVHDSSCLTVSLRKLEQPFPVQNTTLMWGVCKKCRQVGLLSLLLFLLYIY